MTARAEVNIYKVADVEVQHLSKHSHHWSTFYFRDEKGECILEVTAFSDKPFPVSITTRRPE